MLGIRTVRLASRAAVLLVSVGLASLLGNVGVATNTDAAMAQGTVKLEWLGHLFYRFTSPAGVVVLTSPWLTNPEGPVQVDDLVRTDVILVPNSHNDDMGNPLEVAAVSGATVVVPGPLGRWLIDNGLEPTQFRRAGTGDDFVLKDVLFKVGPSLHDNTLPNGADGGPAASYFVTFENGFTVFFNGHTTLIADLAMYAAIYQPDVAILGLTGERGPAEFAQVASLMATNNPKLRAVIPSHQRPGAAIIDMASREMERAGLSHLLFVPDLRTVYEY